MIINRCRQLILLAVGILFCGSASAEFVSGVFLTETNDEGGYLHVEMIACESDAQRQCGIIKRAYNVNEGPSPILDYEHLGKLMVWDMEDHGDGSFSGGKIWAPDVDKTYKSKMKISEDGNTLSVDGCILFICRGQDWTRVE